MNPCTRPRLENRPVKARAIKPVLDGTTMGLYAEDGPAQKAREFWVQNRSQWKLPWTPFNGSTLAVAAGVLGPEALGKFCAALEVHPNEVLSFLAMIVDNDRLIHRDIRAQFPTLQAAYNGVNLTRIDQRLANIPILSENVRVWCFRRARANHNRTLQTAK